MCSEICALRRGLPWQEPEEESINLGAGGGSYGKAEDRQTLREFKNRSKQGKKGEGVGQAIRRQGVLDFDSTVGKTPGKKGSKKSLTERYGKGSHGPPPNSGNRNLPTERSDQEEKKKGRGFGKGRTASLRSRN